MHDDDAPASSTSGDDPDERTARAGELRRLAAANEEATWGDSERSAIRVPGLISGDVGPKGKVGAQLRALSRAERRNLGEVPSGTVVPGTGRFVLLPLLIIAFVLVLAVAAIIWLSW